MPYDLAISLDWQGGSDPQESMGRVRAADESGVHSVWVAEAWGSDAFSAATLIAAQTDRIQIGTGIVNIFSRSPAALAQHFATLDQLSRGRAIIGLGTSGANVIEHFHGVPFRKPLTRMREYVDIINMLISGTPLRYSGEIFDLQRGFTLRMELARPHIPIFIASLTPKSIEQTARIADGWLPIWTPIGDLPSVVTQMKDRVREAGRDPAQFTIRSPGTTIVTPNVEATRAAVAGSLAFYIARMGDFYYEHLSRLGYQDLCDAVRSAWDEGGSKAGTAVIPPAMQQACSFVTASVGEARERLAEERAAGIGLHQVQVSGQETEELRRTYEALAK